MDAHLPVRLVLPRPFRASLAALLLGPFPLSAQPPAVTGVLLGTSRVVGTQSVSATITLGGAASAGGLSVKLTSSDSAVKVPPVVTVAGGQTGVPFTVTTGLVSATRTATITAITSTASASATLTVDAYAITGLRFSPNPMQAGIESAVTITLNAPAPPPDPATNQPRLIVSLTSPVSGMPSGSAGVGAGQSAAAFLVKPACRAQELTGSLDATVRPSVGGAMTLASARVLPARVRLLGFAVDAPNDYDHITGGINGSASSTLPSYYIYDHTLRVRGGRSLQLGLVVSCRMPGSAWTVALSSNTSAAVLSASSMTVPSNDSLRFTVQTQPVAQDVPVTISATLNGQVTTYRFTVTAPVPESFTLSNDTLVANTRGVTGTVRLSFPAPPQGMKVSIAPSTVPAGFSVPSSFIIAGGATSGTFPLSFTADRATLTATSTPVALEIAANGRRLRQGLVLVR
jgi:trimeric autotransporter adhesin